MTRPCLAERVATILPPGSSLPREEDFSAGHDSLLRLLKKKGRLSATALQRFLMEETGRPLLRATEGPGTPAVMLPEGFLRDREMISVGRAGDPLYGMVWPHDIDAVDDLASRLGRDFPRAVLNHEEIHPPRADDDETREGMEPPQEELTLVESILERLGDDQAEVEIVESYDLLEEVGSPGDEAPIIKLLNMIIVQGCRELASDIHIEPEESVSRVRYRVDGLLKEVMLPPKRFHNALVSRVKIMSDLDIAEKRVPQDGRMKLRLGGKNIDVRVSTIPSIYGEKVVLRILHQQSIIRDIEDLGFSPDECELYRSLVTRPYGILLVTGPTGSGKTTTLYSTLNFLNNKSMNIVTIEDPVEYQMENVNQIQVNRKAGVDFASGLKSILRQDPDIIMIGEMRDEETAAIAVKAALTGHLVLSTLHTNDAPGAYGRLQDMKVAPYLLASAVVGVVAQRLVRRICSGCRTEDQPEEEALRLIGLHEETDVSFFRGGGCSRCAGTGYRGREAVYEILTPTPEIKKLILAGQLSDGSQLAGFERMIDKGRAKVREGVTTVEEICRVVRLQEAY